MLGIATHGGTESALGAPLTQLTGASTTDWVVFIGTVLGTMLVDRLLFGKGGHHISFREASLRSVLWVLVGLLFTVYIWLEIEPRATGPGVPHPRGLDYLVAFLVEKSLSVDNLFVFLVIFDYFKINDHQQQRALRWGIMGAVIMRAIFILAGTALLHRFHWMTWVFGAFLIFSGLKLAFRKEGDVDPEGNVALRLARHFLRTTTQLDGDAFFIRKDSKLYATPLFLVLIVIEATDVVFAVDSVPAVLAISKDLFVVYTSNIFAILGLRALYFMLAGMMKKFHYLDLALAAILVFVGAKMGVAQFFKVPSWVSLVVIGGLLTAAVVASLVRPKDRPSVA